MCQMFGDHARREEADAYRNHRLLSGLITSVKQQSWKETVYEVLFFRRKSEIGDTDG